MGIEMKITEVEIFAIEMPRHGRTWHPVIVKINTNKGIYGAGEVALAYGIGSRAGVGMVRDLAERFLIGADPFRIEQLWDNMYHKTAWGHGGGPIVFGGISAIDEALWDIKGKALSLPIYELLGGPCWDKLRVYANGWYRGCVTPEDYAKAAKRVVSDGYNALKFDPFVPRPDGIWDYPRRTLDRERADLAYERVKAVREAVGPKIDIMVDCFGNLGVTAAIQVGKRLEEFDLFFYEEPMDAHNVDCMKKISDNVNIPIAAGERLYTRYGFRQYIEKQAIDILQPDIGLAGGITETKKIASYAETYNLHVQPHNCASPVATAAAVQLDACMTNFIIQEWFPYQPKANYRLVKEALEPCVVDGFLEVPNTPGLGIELNEKELSKYECIQIS
jgi:galactonate dehydratase